MLYVTTRNDSDAFTSPRTLIQDRAADGGFYAPFRLPLYEDAQIAALKDKTFGQNVAQLLNQFFNLGIESWDVDFCIGRSPVKLTSISSKIIIAEAWHNPESDYAYVIKQLNRKLRPESDTVSDWAVIAIRISVLFGIFGQLMPAQEFESTGTVDVAVSANDFTGVIAVWYARKMGLPIGTILCGCSDNDALWDLIHKGELSTRNLSDAAKQGLEQLIHCTLGCASVREFCKCCEKASQFSISDEQLRSVSSGMFTAVVSDKRASTIISSVFKKNSYVIDDNTVPPYGALQDYRARAGENKLTLMCVDTLPAKSPANII